MKRVSVTEMTFESGRVLRPGMRVVVKTRHGTTGIGIIRDIQEGGPIPATMLLDMEVGTVYAPAEAIQKGWPSDQIRIRDHGVFGGEIESVLQLH